VRALFTALQSLQGLSACLFRIQQRQVARNGANVLADRQKCDVIPAKYIVAANRLVSSEYFQINRTGLLTAMKHPA
jgi:hypothetical protein